ncbi:MAG: MBL fold metallo-hydrolase [Dehalococcoidia bacterium]
MTTRARWLGVSGYEIEGPNHRILVDPFLSENPMAPVDHEELERPDVILVTHAPFDHMGDTSAIAKRTGAPVVCGGDVRLALIDQGVPESQITPTIWGISIQLGDLTVRPVECHHWSSYQLASGEMLAGVPLAWIFETEPGVRFYHFGDTAIFDMNLIGELYEPTVGLLGCGLPVELLDRTPGPGHPVTGELTADEAGRVAEMLGVRIAVAGHYLGHTPETDLFADAVARHDPTGNRQAIVPTVGDTLVFEGEKCWIEKETI